MDILPTLRIGIWNAWILMLFFPLQPLIIRGIEMATGAGFIMKRMGDQPTNPRERDLNLAYLAIEGLLILYSIFLPLRLGTFWIYVGVSLYLLGLLIFLGVCFSVVKTPEDKPFTSGVYRFSRHPGYLSQSIIFLGVAVAAASWIFLILTIILWVLMALFVGKEEKMCAESYGEVYQDYVKRTPRWLGIPKARGKYKTHF
jgi:protein-S-isoprenylcysteine O-methyltransferase Ste14